MNPRIALGCGVLALCVGLIGCGGESSDEPATLESSGASQADTAAPAEAKPIGLDSWHYYYYQDPQPERLPDWLMLLARREFFNNYDRTYPAAVFVSHLLSDYPELARPTIERLREVPFRQRWGFTYGLWLSGIDEANDILNEEAELAPNPADADRVRGFIGPEPYDVLQVAEKDMNPTTLDMLWEGFFATGDEAYVRRVCDVLPDPARSDDSDDWVKLSTTAEWSLGEFGWRHARVVDLLQRWAVDPKMTDAQRASIARAIEDIDTRLSKAASPDPRRGG